MQTDLALSYVVGDREGNARCAGRESGLVWLSSQSSSSPASPSSALGGDRLCKPNRNCCPIRTHAIKLVLCKC